MKNIFKFLLVFLGLCQVASAVTIQNPLPPHEELPASKPANFINARQILDLTNVDTSEGCGIKNKETQLTYAPLTKVIAFLDWDSRRNLMEVSKSMLSGFLTITSVPMESEYATLSLRALFPGIKLNTSDLDRAFSKYFLPANSSLAEFIAAGAGISLTCVLPTERQMQLVKRNISPIYGAGSEIPWSIGSTVSNTVLEPDAVYRLLVDNVIAGQPLPSKLEICVKNVLNFNMAEPAAATIEDALKIANAEHAAYLGCAPTCEKCSSGDNSCWQIEQATKLSAASFAEIEAAAMDTSQQQCFSEVKRLFCTRLAQEGEHQNLEKLHQMASNSQREAQAVLLAQKLGLPDFPIDNVEKQKEYFDRFSDAICSAEYSDSVEALIAKGFKYVKDDHAHYLALTSSRLSFIKSLQECLTGDHDMTYLTRFCKPAVWALNVKFSCSIAHETLLQFLIELRTAQRAKAFAKVTA